MIEKQILKKSEAVQFQVVSSAVCTTLHAYVLTGVWKTILNDAFHFLEMLV